MANRKGPGKKAPGIGNESSASASAPRRTQAAVSAPKGRSGNPSPGGKNPRASWVILFWLAFAIFIFGLFLFNREAIVNTIDSIKNRTSAGSLPGEARTLSAEEPETPPPAENPAGVKTPPPPLSSPAPAGEKAPPRVSPPSVQPAVQSAPEKTPPSSPVRAAESAPQNAPPVSPPAVQPAAQAAPPAETAARQIPSAAQAAPPAAKKPAEQRERSLYFMQVDRGGTILRVKVSRRFPVSDSPMTDVIEALVAGPNGDEKSRGLMSLIPPATRILSTTTVRGETAYLNFSEDFQYNVYGVEGYAGQIRQIVFTVTEFPNVRDVQILIEGRRVDYLGEGVWIGSPLNREML